MPIFNILSGGLILFFGRQLFWAFIGVVGFLFGLEAAGIYLSAQTAVVQWTLALACGAVGIVLAIAFYRVAVVLAGILAGGYFALQMGVLYFNMSTAASSNIAFFIGALIGGILAAALLDWAIILLSALTGSMLIIESFPLDAQTGLFLFFALFAVGFLVQGSLYKPPQKEAPSEGQ